VGCDLQDGLGVIHYRRQPVDQAAAETRYRESVTSRITGGFLRRMQR